LGVQFHPEADKQMFERKFYPTLLCSFRGNSRGVDIVVGIVDWTKGVRQRHIAKGATPPVTEQEQEELLKQSESPELKEAAYALFDAWTKTITSVDSSPVA